MIHAAGHTHPTASRPSRLSLKPDARRRTATKLCAPLGSHPVFKGQYGAFQSTPTLALQTAAGRWVDRFASLRPASFYIFTSGFVAEFEASRRRDRISFSTIPPGPRSPQPLTDLRLAGCSTDSRANAHHMHANDSAVTLQDGHACSVSRTHGTTLIEREIRGLGSCPFSRVAADGAAVRAWGDA